MLRLPERVLRPAHSSAGSVTRVQLNADIAQLLSGQFATAVIGLITLVLYIAVMFIYSVPLTLVAIGIGLLNLVALRLVAARRIGAANLLQHEQVRLDGVAFGGLADHRDDQGDGRRGRLLRALGRASRPMRSTPVSRSVG